MLVRDFCRSIAFDHTNAGKCLAKIAITLYLLTPLDHLMANPTTLKDLSTTDPISHSAGVTLKNHYYFSPWKSSLDSNWFWKTDGTPQGTEKFGTSQTTNAPLYATADKLFLVRHLANGVAEACVSDGDSITPIHELSPGEAFYFCELDGRILVSSEKSYGQLLSLDTEASTITLLENVSARNLTTIGEVTYFSGNGTPFPYNRFNPNYELWKTDGTSTGTILLKEIDPGLIPHQTDPKIPPYYTNASSAPSHFTEYNDSVYFLASNISLGRSLWKTDGTPGGTTQVLVGFSSITDLVLLGDWLYFSNGGNPAQGLWKSDGTQQGTSLIRSGWLPTLDLFVADNEIYFSGFEGSSGAGIWVSDGTSTGTSRVHEFPRPYNNPTNFGLVNNQLLFEISQGHGTPIELWKLNLNTSEVSKWTSY